MFRTLVAGIMVSMLAACSTTPINPEQAPRLETSFVMDPTLLQASPEKSSIRVARDSGTWGSAIDILIYLDGRHVASINANRVLQIWVPPGAHKVGMQSFNAAYPVTYLDVTTRAGEVADFRVYQDGSDWQFTRR